MIAKQLLAALVLLSGMVYGAETFGWRKDTTGRYPEATPPEKWSKTEAVLWKCALPAWSNANPVIVGDRIFVLSEPDQLVCISKTDGKILWQQGNSALDGLPEAERTKAKEALDKAQADLKKRDDLKREAGGLTRKARQDPAAKEQLDAVKKQIAELDEKVKGLESFLPVPTHGENGQTSATPLSDGTHVYAIFNSGVAACYDLEGKRKWLKVVDRPFHDWGHCASPVLAGGKLITHYKQVVALEAASGDEAWRAQSAPSWGSPVAVKIGGVDVLITATGDFVRISDGKVLGRVTAKNTYNGPLVVENKVFFIDEGGAKAFELPAEAGDSIAPKQLWASAPKKERYYASPVYHNDLLFATTRYGDYSVLDAKTGEVVATRSLKDLDAQGQPFYPSLALAGKYLYINSEFGKTLIVEPAKEWKEIGRCDLEATKSSPVFEGTRMYVRARSGLYCVGK